MEYEHTFEKFNKEGFFPTWSWCGFIFGFLWYLIKGMWAKGLLLMFLSLLTIGLAIIPIWIYCGIFGKWDYYLLKVKKKQMW